MSLSEAQSNVLSEFDFVVVLDASGSMSTEDMKGRSRWAYMQESVESFARDVSKFDSDGIDLVVLSGSTGIDSHQGVSAEHVAQVFRQRSPRGSTPMAEALQAALKLAGKNNKKDFILVFTDGVPDDQNAVARVLRDASNALNADDELTVLFVQVGYDQSATAYLRNLDDNLKGAKFDIVDCKTIEEAERFASTGELILAAIAD